MIDDPISSLSFEAVFNIASLIKDTFIDNKKLRPEYKQVFILTHHLVFLNELQKAGFDCSCKNETQYHRILKTNNQTCFNKMNAEEVRNHYQSLWKVLRDFKENQHAEMDANFVITPHVLRHTAISNLIMAGIDIPTVQAISGHKTVQMVMRYTHQHNDHVLNALDRLETAYQNGDAKVIPMKNYTEITQKHEFGLGSISQNAMMTRGKARKEKYSQGDSNRLV